MRALLGARCQAATSDMTYLTARSWFNELPTDVLHRINMVNNVGPKLWCGKNSDRGPNAITINNACAKCKSSIADWLGPSADWVSGARLIYYCTYEPHVFSGQSNTGLNTLTWKWKWIQAKFKAFWQRGNVLINIILDNVLHPILPKSLRLRNSFCFSVQVNAAKKFALVGSGRRYTQEL
jgi:hypothetical protein